LSFSASLALPSFSTLSHEGHDFRKNVAEYEICVLIFCTAFILNISHSEKNSEKYCHKCENVFMYSTHYSCQILMKLKSSRQIFRKKAQVSYFYKICPAGAELFHADGQTDRYGEADSHILRFSEGV
jgi:hypothetical protein